MDLAEPPERRRADECHLMLLHLLRSLLLYWAGVRGRSGRRPAACKRLSQGGSADYSEH